VRRESSDNCTPLDVAARTTTNRPNAAPPNKSNQYCFQTVRNRQPLTSSEPPQLY
jgi:hypothetical protein